MDRRKDVNFIDRSLFEGLRIHFRSVASYRDWIFLQEFFEFDIPDFMVYIPLIGLIPESLFGN
jgi:hypothetical protein